MSSYAERGDDFNETPDCCTLAAFRHDLLRIAGYEPGARVWEPCAGKGAISRVLTAAGYRVIAQDLNAWPGADDDIRPGVDFFDEQVAPDGCRVIFTNPPYKLDDEFVRHGLSLVDDVFVLMRGMYVEGIGRSDLIDRHCHGIWFGADRPPTMHRHGWTGTRLKKDIKPFAWFWFRAMENERGFVPLRRVLWGAAE